MKRKIFLFTAVLLLTLTLSSCSIKNIDTAQTEPSLENENLSEKANASFTDSTMEISTALALALYDSTSTSSIDTPQVVRDTLGWFCCQREGSPKYVSAVKCQSIQAALRPGKEQFTVDTIADGINATVKEIDGVAFIGFEKYVNAYTNRFSSLNKSISANENEKTCVVEFTDIETEGKVTFTFSFREGNPGSGFGYVLTGLEREDSSAPSPDNENPAPFTIEDVIKANYSSALLKNHKTLSYTEYSSDKEIKRGYYFLYNDIPVSALKKSDGYAFTYDGVAYEKNGETYTGKHFEGEKSGEFLVENASFSPAYIIYSGKISSLKEENGLYTFYITDPASTEDSGGSFYKINKSDLSLTEALLNIGSENETKVELCYDCETEDYGFTEGWEKEKTVTVAVSVFDEEGNEGNVGYEVTLPYNLELLPYINESYSLYGENEKEYSYPGNSVDYTVSLKQKQ